MPYLVDVSETYGDRIQAWPSETRGRLDLLEILDELSPNAAVYCCGPETLLVAIEELAHARGLDVHVERFAPRPQERGTEAEFEVLMAESSRTVTVAADESVLVAVNRAGASVLSTCREGTCDSYEVRVLAGIPEHRDSVLSPEERASGTYMMSCDSWAPSDFLTLDL